MTVKNLIKHVRKLAATYPDFVYPRPQDVGATGCKYKATETQPACIFGQALEQMGISILPEWENQTIETLLVKPSSLPFGATPIQSFWCGQVQAHQDCSHPWAECIQYADTQTAKKVTQWEDCWPSNTAEPDYEPEQGFGSHEDATGDHETEAERNT